MPSCTAHVRFSNRPIWVKRFQTVYDHSVDVTHGLVLLFGIGARPLYGAFLVKKFKVGGASFFVYQFCFSI
jgi:hypothetical protein